MVVMRRAVSDVSLGVGKFVWAVRTFVEAIVFRTRTSSLIANVALDLPCEMFYMTRTAYTSKTFGSAKNL